MSLLNRIQKLTPLAPAALLAACGYTPMPMQPLQPGFTGEQTANDNANNIIRISNNCFNTVGKGQPFQDCLSAYGTSMAELRKAIEHNDRLTQQSLNRVINDVYAQQYPNGGFQAEAKQPTRTTVEQGSTPQYRAEAPASLQSAIVDFSDKYDCLIDRTTTTRTDLNGKKFRVPAVDLHIITEETGRDAFSVKGLTAVFGETILSTGPQNLSATLSSNYSSYDPSAGQCKFELTGEYNGPVSINVHDQAVNFGATIDFITRGFDM